MDVLRRERPRDDRPWGSFVVLEEGADYKVKQISVLPGKRLSYQLHQHRSEHWFIVRGKGIATINDSPVNIQVGASIDVSTGVPHRIENVGPEELVLIEVQQGSYLGEDDIVRLADDFGRCTEPSARRLDGD